MVDIYKEINYLPGKVQSLFSLGLLYDEVGNAQNAIKKFSEVLSINPRHLQARDKLKEIEERN